VPAAASALTGPAGPAEALGVAALPAPVHAVARSLSLAEPGELTGHAAAGSPLWYDLSEIVGYIELFRAARDDTEDAAESWRNLKYFLRPVERWPQLRLPAT